MEASALFFPSCHFIGPTLAPAVLYALFYQFTVPHSSNPLIRRPMPMRFFTSNIASALSLSGFTPTVQSRQFRGEVAASWCSDEPAPLPTWQQGNR